jgi:hypothetical protein
MKGVAIAALLLAAGIGLAQRQFSDAEGTGVPRAGEWHFVRLQYTDLPQHSRGGYRSSRSGIGSGWWMMDWPDAENHFTAGLDRLTRIQTGDPRHVRLTDDELFEYPYLYATQTGYWNLSDAETARLREYLLRGGFLMTDDCWSPREHETFRLTMERALPGQPILDIADTDEVMHVMYDILPKDRTFIPGSRHLRNSPSGSVVIQQPPGTNPEWKAIYDPKGRMVVAVNFDTDIADAWEFQDAPFYPEAMTSLAYRFGINYLVYAMTH